MIFKMKKSDYAESEGPVRFLDGRGLDRPLDPTRPTQIAMGIFVAAAIVIGIVLLVNVLDTVGNSSARAQASVEENLARPVTLDLPNLPTLFTQDDATIQQGFTDAGFTTYALADAEDYPAGGFDIMKLPSDVTLVDAGILMAGGIDNLSAGDAAKLLNGSWRMTVDRGDYDSMSVRYADFTSGSLETAVQAAMVAEGFDVATIGEGGVDDVGNTYQSGTIDVGGTVYSWRVSAIPLSDMYDISGLPETAVYVGIRMTP